MNIEISLWKRTDHIKVRIRSQEKVASNECWIVYTESVHDHFWYQHIETDKDYVIHKLNLMFYLLYFCLYSFKEVLTVMKIVY